MWTLSQVQAEYRRLDRLLGIDTGRVAVSFSKRMTRQYGVCTFVKNKPQEIRLADFLRQEDQVFWDTARHEYAHAAVALLTGKRHGHDEAWKAVCRKIGCPPERLAPNCNAAVENQKRIEAVRGVYVVTCLGCGTQSRYLRRGTVVQALEEQRGGIRCRRCGGKKFRLEKRGQWLRAAAGRRKGYWQAQKLRRSKQRIGFLPCTNLAKNIPIFRKNQ